MVSDIQSILFDNKKWDAPSALEWLHSHNFYPRKKPHFTKKKIRFRIKPPYKFARFRTLKRKNGIEFIIGFYEFY